MDRLKILNVHQFSFGRKWKIDSFSIHFFYFKMSRSRFYPFINKGTVSVISSDLPFINSYVRFTTVPFKPLSGQRWGDAFICIAED